MSTIENFDNYNCSKCGHTIPAHVRHVYTIGFGRWDYCTDCYKVDSVRHRWISTKFIPSWDKLYTCKYETKLELP